MLSSRITPSLRRAALRTMSTSSSSSSSTVPAAKPSSSTTPAPAATAQAPNYPTTWSTHQRQRPNAASGPRFEQTIMELQPAPLSALEMIANEPVRVVQGRKAVCDGGVGPLGHPKIFINLDKPGPQPCGYCGIRFEQDPHHSHSGH